MDDKNRKREVEIEMKKLEQNGVVCTLEGENVFCTAEAVRKVEGFRIPVNLFNAEAVLKRFQDTETS